MAVQLRVSLLVRIVVAAMVIGMASTEFTNC